MSNPDGPAEICSAHLHFIMFVNLFLLIFAITGCCLDRKNKCIFTPTYKENTDVEEKGGHKKIANSSLSLSLSVG